MKGNKVTIISSLFLITALCGCTTQSVDKAKEIEESNTYVYKYEYETNTEGQAETQYHEEKPSFDDSETVTKGTIASLRNKNGSLKLIKMNEVYEWGGMECSIAEAHMTTNVDKNEKIVWVRVHIKNTGTKDKELNMSSDGVQEISERDYKPTVTSILIDKELCFQGETNHRDIVRIKADCEQDLWYALGIFYYDEQTKYYMFGSFGYIFDPSDYSGILIELNDIQDEG
uniref:hypothetical protein n=1 Tax=Lachnospira eligens TaxID=39485 RepID=UPI0040275BE6